MGVCPTAVRRTYQNKPPCEEVSAAEPRPRAISIAVFGVSFVVVAARRLREQARLIGQPSPSETAPLLLDRPARAMRRVWRSQVDQQLQHGAQSARQAFQNGGHVFRWRGTASLSKVQMRVDGTNLSYGPWRTSIVI